MGKEAKKLRTLNLRFCTRTIQNLDQGDNGGKPKKPNGKEDNGLLISFLNCYAAGIFFATCILHMLPEISEKMKNEILKGNRAITSSRKSRTKLNIKIIFIYNHVNPFTSPKIERQTAILRLVEKMNIPQSLSHKLFQN